MPAADVVNWQRKRYLVVSAVAVADMAQSKTRMGGFLGALFGGIGPNFDFTAADANQDGNVSPEELAAYRAARLTAIDANNDGIVSTEELTVSQSAAEAERAARKAARGLLRRIRAELRATVGAALQLKSTPELQFAEDDVTGGVARVQALLDEMARRDAGTPPPAE